MSGIVQMSTLGKNGRFGNQLFAFVFIKAYAEKYDAELQIPRNWIGRSIFKNMEDITPTNRVLPLLPLDFIPNGDVNINFYGYFQFQEAYDFLSLSKIREWLQFKDEWVDLLTPKNTNYISCHLRRGDYETKYSHIYCTISEESYLEAVSFYGYNPNDIIWVSEQKPRLKLDCLGFNFLPDFFTLMNGEVLFRSNSTFSVWASILGRKDMITYAPIVEGITGVNKNVNFQWGNWHKVIEDYQGASPRQPAEFIFKE